MKKQAGGARKKGKEKEGRKTKKGAVKSRKVLQVKTQGK